MSSKRKSPPTKLSEGGGGVVTNNAEEEEDPTICVTSASSSSFVLPVAEIGSEEIADSHEDYYHSSGCSSPGTPSEAESRGSPSPSLSPTSAKRRKLLFLASQDARNQYHQNHNHRSRRDNTHLVGPSLERASSSECGSPPTPDISYYPHHHNNNNNAVTPNNNNNNSTTANNNNGTGLPNPASKRSMDDVLKRLTCKSMSIHDDPTNQRTPPPSSTPTSHHTYRWDICYFILQFIEFFFHIVSFFIIVCVWFYMISCLFTIQSMKRKIVEIWKDLTKQNDLQIISEIRVVTFWCKINMNNTRVFYRSLSIETKGRVIFMTSTQILDTQKEVIFTWNNVALLRIKINIPVLKQN